MYNTPSIKEILDNLMNTEELSFTTIVDTIINFIEKFKNKDVIRNVFMMDEVDEIGEKLGLWTIDKNFYFGSENAESNKPIEELTAMLKTVVETNKLSDEEKRNFIVGFADYFGECSEDEDFCDKKIYVIIKKNKSDGEIDIVNEYNNWDEASSDIDNTYIGCCDDAYLAEVMWFNILCWVRDQQADEYKNFCSIIEFDAEDIEDGRESWEAENCEQDEDEEFEKDDEE